MDPMEKMDPESHEWGYIGRKFFASKLWAPTAATPYIAKHLQSIQAYPPRQGADTLSMHVALEKAMAKLDNPAGSSNCRPSRGGRSEERRVGKECVSTGSSRWSRDH